MPTPITNSSDLRTITDFTALQLTKDGGLVKQSGFQSFMRSIGDFFKRLTTSGRAEIAGRNDQIYSAMQRIVESEQQTKTEQLHNDGELLYKLDHLDAQIPLNDQLKALCDATPDQHVREILRRTIELGDERAAENMPVAEQLSQMDIDTLKQRLTTHFLKETQENFKSIKQNFSDAVHANSARFYTDVQNHLMRQVDKQMRGEKAEGIKDALKMYTNSALRSRNPVSSKEFSSTINKLYATLVKPYDETLRGPVMQKILYRQISEFCKPAQQAQIIDGIHSTFDVDIERAIVKSIGDTPIVNGRPIEEGKNILREFVGEDHAHFLPFISMMTSQGGILGDSIFIESDFGRLSPAELVAAGLLYTDGTRNNTMEKDANGDILIKMNITSSIHTAPGMNPEDESAAAQNREPVLLTRMQMQATLRVKMNEEPDMQQINGRNVVVPQCSVENLSVRPVH